MRRLNGYKDIVYMNRRLTQKQENFCLNLFKGMSQREAYIMAGYSPRQSPATIDRHAYELANTDKVLARWGELNKKAMDATMADVVERKQLLAKIAREDNEGKFGYQRSPNIQAIAELNKMERIYEAEGSITIDNRTLNIYVKSEKGKELTERLIEGERTE